MATNQLTGAEAFVRMLQRHDVKYVFGLCGDTSLPLYDALYRLDIALRESAQSTLVEIDGDAKGLVFALNADFKLTRRSDNAVIMTGRAQSRAAYQKVESIFANIRARRDAEDRAAKMIADSIRTRVAAKLSETA